MEDDLKWHDNKQHNIFIYMKHFGPIESWEITHYTSSSHVGNFRDDTDVNLNFLENSLKYKLLNLFNRD